MKFTYITTLREYLFALFQLNSYSFPNQITTLLFHVPECAAVCLAARVTWILPPDSLVPSAAQDCALWPEELSGHCQGAKPGFPRQLRPN